MKNLIQPNISVLLNRDCVMFFLSYRWLLNSFLWNIMQAAILALVKLNLDSCLFNTILYIWCHFQFSPYLSFIETYSFQKLYSVQLTANLRFQSCYLTYLKSWTFQEIGNRRWNTSPTIGTPLVCSPWSHDVISRSELRQCDVLNVTVTSFDN